MESYMSKISDIPLDTFIVLCLILLFSIWILLPLIPSLLIYWIFPDTQVATSGPLKGLTIKASGAFAAYLIILLLSIELPLTGVPTIHNFERPVWRVTGHIRFVDQANNVIESKSLLDSLAIQIVPDPFDHKSGKIKFEVYADQDGSLPEVLLMSNDKWTTPIDLNPEHLKGVADIDSMKKKISFRTPFEIRVISPNAAYEHRSPGLSEALPPSRAIPRAP